MLIHNIWMKLSIILSKIIPNFLLIFIYFLILTPVAFFAKVFNAKSDYKSKNNSNSFFVNVNKTFEKSSFEKTW